MISRLALLACVLAGCASAAPARERAVGAGGSANQQGGGEAVAEGGPPPPMAAEWRECSIEGRAIWMPIPEGAAFVAEHDGCFALPHEGATPETAAWLLAFGLIDADHSHVELLAIEPDGARRFLVEDAEVRDARPIGEGAVTLLGTATRWYAVRGVADELGARDVAIARVPTPGGWIVAVAATAQTDQAQLDRLVRLFPLARPR